MLRRNVENMVQDQRDLGNGRGFMSRRLTPLAATLSDGLCTSCNPGSYSSSSGVNEFRALWSNRTSGPAATAVVESNDHTEHVVE